MSDLLWLFALLCAPFAGWLLAAMICRRARRRLAVRIDGLRIRPSGRLKG